MVDGADLAPTFEALVDTALHVEGVSSSEATRRYLVRLLLTFVRPSKADLLDPPLGPSLLTALSLPPRERVAHLQRVGDTALFLTGLFVERLDRTLVGPNYYVSLGRTAYGHLSTHTHGGGTAHAYHELAARFIDFVRVLGAIAEAHLFNAPSDLARLYRHWLTTRSPRTAAALLRRGITPWAPERPDRARH